EGLYAYSGPVFTALSSTANGYVQVKIGLPTVLTPPFPQINNTTQTMIHGTSDHQPCFRVGSGPAARGAGIVAAEASWLRNAGEVHNSAGCQNLKNPIKQAMQISEAPISTIHGLTKFEIRNCGIAKDTPQTRIAGQICTVPR